MGGPDFKTPPDGTHKRRYKTDDLYEREKKRKVADQRTRGFPVRKNKRGKKRYFEGKKVSYRGTRSKVCRRNV